MPGPWDTLMKHLIRTKPQHLVSWILKRAQFKERLSEEITVTLYSDGLLLVELDGQRIILSLEFQSKADPRIRERLQEYNILASREHNYLPVFSCIIYLRKNINVTPSPLIRKLPNGKQYDRFDFEEIELAEISAMQLLQTGLFGLFPLALLAKDGRQPEVVETVTTTLANAEEKELLAIAYTLGGMVFSTEPAKEWYKRRFHMFEEMIRDTWVYEEIGQERFKKGELQGELQGLREAVLEIARERFPEIEALTKEQVEAVTTASVLLRLIGNMSKAPTTKEAALAVLAVNDEEIKQQ